MRVVRAAAMCAFLAGLCSAGSCLTGLFLDALTGPARAQQLPNINLLADTPSKTPEEKEAGRADGLQVVRTRPASRPSRTREAESNPSFPFAAPQPALARFHSPKRPDRGLTNVRIRIPQRLPERWQGRPGVMTDQSQSVRHFRAHLCVRIP